MGPSTGGATDRLAAALGAAGPTLAAVLRSGLIGLGAALEVAVEAAPAETGAEACRALAADLRRLATSSVTEMAPLEEPRPLSPAPAALPAGEPLRLAGLVAELKADPRAAPILGPDDLEAAGQAASDAEAWGAVQRLLLRLPAAAAATWRARALACAGRAGARADESDAAFPGPGDTLPLDDGDEVIYPGLCGAIRAPGLRAARSAPIDPRLGVDRARPMPHDMDRLARVVSAQMARVEADPSLHHALESLARFSLKPAGDDYLEELARRFRLALDAGPDPVAALLARLDLDEAIHSLVARPPGDRESWWGRLHREARATLEPVAQGARAAGHRVELRWLWGRYADVRSSSKNDVNLPVGATPGSVLACLRPYAEVNGKPYPGRVIYRVTPASAPPRPSP